MRTQFIKDGIFLELLKTAQFDYNEDFRTSSLEMRFKNYKAVFYDQNEDIENPSIVEEDFGFVIKGDAGYVWKQCTPTEAQQELIVKLYNMHLDVAFEEAQIEKERKIQDAKDYAETREAVEFGILRGTI